MNDFIVSTTSSLEGYTISSYLGPIVVPTVGAGNIIRDWFAGFTDLVGGKSHGYKKVFARFINEGVQEMIRQAKEYGANGIVNLRLETTNISAGKSMISLILYGTAVRIEKAETIETGGSEIS